MIQEPEFMSKTPPEVDSEDSDDPDVLLKRYVSLKKNKFYGNNYDKVKTGIHTSYTKWYDDKASSELKE